MLKNIRTGLIAHPDVLVAWIPVDCVSLSELDLSGKLQNALRVAEGCCCNRSEGAWCGDAGRRASEDGVVEYVEGLDVEFECKVFVDLSDSTYQIDPTEIEELAAATQVTRWPRTNRIAIVSTLEIAGYHRLYFLRTELAARGLAVEIFRYSRVAIDWLGVPG